MLYSDFINNGGELVFRGDSLTHTYTEGFTIDIDVANIHVLEPSASGIVVVLPNSTSLLAENQIFVNNTDFDVSLEVDGTAYLLASKTVFFFSWNGTKWIKGKGSVIELTSII